MCERAGHVRFRSAKSPLMTGDVMRVGRAPARRLGRTSVDAEAWLDFPAGTATATCTLTLAKVDPEADFSYDYEDLEFSRVGDCPIRNDEIDALMRPYDGDGSRRRRARGAGWRAVVRRTLRARRPRAGHAGPPATNFRLASVTKQFTAAAILLLARTGASASTIPPGNGCPAAGGDGRGDDPPVADAHLGLIDYEEVIPASLTRNSTTRMCSRCSRTRTARISRRARLIATATAAMRCSRSIVERASGQRSRRSSRGGSSSRSAWRAPWRIQDGISRSPTALSATATKTEPGCAPTRARPARSSATAESTRRSTIWRNGMPRSTTSGCSARNRASSLSRRPRTPTTRRRLRFRVAHHRRDALALRRDDEASVM